MLYAYIHDAHKDGLSHNRRYTFRVVTNTGGKFSAELRKAQGNFTVRNRTVGFSASTGYNYIPGYFVIPPAPGCDELSSFKYFVTAIAWIDFAQIFGIFLSRSESSLLPSLGSDLLATLQEKK